MDRTELTTLATRLLNPIAGLHKQVIASFDTPQVGPYHQEGNYLVDHLIRMFNEWRRLAGRPEMSEVLEVALNQVEYHIENGEDLIALYIVLHDAWKGDEVMQVKLDGLPEMTMTRKSWAKWVKTMGSQDKDPVDIAKAKGMLQVSYEDHAEVAAVQLECFTETLKLPEWFVRVVLLHMVAIQLAQVNVPLYERSFANLPEEAWQFLTVVTWLDAQGAVGEDGNCNISGWNNLISSKWAAESYRRVERAIRKADRLDGQKMERALSDLRNSHDIFHNETPDESIDRLKRECALPKVTEADVRNALANIEGLGEALIATIAAEMATDGKLSPDTGRALGRFNKPVRDALKSLG
ncbi:MAG: hypothetical protein WCW16_02190 [Candidatus Magasanikbacteria bacterium]